MPEKPLDESTVLAVARAAGLDKVVDAFRAELFAAARTAAQVRGAYTLPADPASEPWPPMRTGGES